MDPSGDATEQKLTEIPPIEETPYLIKFEDGDLPVQVNSHHFLLSEFLRDIQAMGFDKLKGNELPVPFKQASWDLIDGIISYVREKHAAEYLKFLNHEKDIVFVSLDYKAVVEKNKYLINAANLSSYLGLHLTKKVLISKLRQCMVEHPEENTTLLNCTPIDKAMCEAEGIGKDADIWNSFPKLREAIFGIEAKEE